jgi:hypothetical protein
MSGEPLYHDAQLVRGLIKSTRAVQSSLPLIKLPRDSERRQCHRVIRDIISAGSNYLASEELRLDHLIANLPEVTQKRVRCDWSLADAEGDLVRHRRAVLRLFKSLPPEDHIRRKLREVHTGVLS